MVVLGIESAIGGGSLAVGNGSSIHRSSDPEMSISRAEDLIPNIEMLLKQANISTNDLELIAVSRGPGSFTGIRIGISTAIGLARALDIKCIGLSMFDAISEYYSFPSDCLIALPFGKSDVAWKAFPKNGEPTEAATSLDELIDLIIKEKPSMIYGFEEIERRLRGAKIEAPFKIIEPTLAEILVKQAPNHVDSTDLSPIYLQNSQRATQLF